VPKHSVMDHVVVPRSCRHAAATLSDIGLDSGEVAEKTHDAAQEVVLQL